MKQTQSTKILFLFRTLALIAFVSLVLLSCNQDSIFYNLSLEPRPVDPRVPGSPTNLAYANDKIYVGTRMSKTIHCFNGSGWTSMGTIGGSLGELASDGANLYALVFPGGNPLKSSVVKMYDGSAWTEYSTPAGYSIQTIYCAGGVLFAGAQTANYYTYAILQLNAGVLEEVPLGSTTSLLKGAAESNGIFYFATLNNGVISYNGASAAAITGTSGNITGIIETGGVITAVSSNGRAYTLDPSAGDTEFSLLVSPGTSFTGAMCIWSEYTPALPPAEITISPSVVTLEKGASQSFSAATTLSDPITWSLSGNDDPDTEIDEISPGVFELSIAAGETSLLLTITAASDEDPSKSASAQITVAESGDLHGYVTIDFIDPLIQGTQLEANITELSEPSPSYQWKRNNTDIAGATSSAYLITAEDIGADISVTVSDGANGITSAVLKITAPTGEKPRLLLLGIRDEGAYTNHGYREIMLDGNGKPTPSIKTPGEESLPTSARSKRAKYEATIGIHPVESILQVPGSMAPAAASEFELPVFASTSVNGLWVCRRGEWNAEE